MSAANFVSINLGEVEIFHRINETFNLLVVFTGKASRLHPPGAMNARTKSHGNPMLLRYFCLEQHCQSLEPKHCSMLQPPQVLSHLYHWCKISVLTLNYNKRWVSKNTFTIVPLSIRPLPVGSRWTDALSLLLDKYLNIVCDIKFECRWIISSSWSSISHCDSSRWGFEYENSTWPVLCESYEQYLPLSVFKSTLEIDLSTIFWITTPALNIFVTISRRNQKKKKSMEASAA